MSFARELIWDEWNVEHIGRHGLDPREVEEMCFSRPHITRARRNTFRAIGQMAAGRYITAILVPRERGTYYPVTARDATEQERRLYRKGKGGELE